MYFNSYQLITNISVNILWFLEPTNPPQLVCNLCTPRHKHRPKKKKNHISSKAPVLLSAPGAEILVFSISTKSVLLTLCCISTQIIRLCSAPLRNSYWFSMWFQEAITNYKLKIKYLNFPSRASLFWENFEFQTLCAVLSYFSRVWLFVTPWTIACMDHS